MFKSKTWRVRFTSIVLIAALSFGSVALANDYSGKASYAKDQKVVARVEAERAIEHIKYLSESIGSRPGGLEGELKAAQYIADTLKGYGYEAELQKFPVKDQYIGTVVFNNGQEWEMGASPMGIMTEGVSGEVIFVNGGKNITDFPNEANGKIVLMQRESATADLRQQVENAVAVGAKGVIVYSLVGSRGNYGSAFNPSLVTNVDIPVLGSSYIQGVWLQEELAKGSVELTLKTKAYTNLKSVNVIAKKTPKDKKVNNAPVIILGAHLDSVIGAPGANDNASGIGLMLELARVYKSYNTEKEIRFIAFGSEERGLVGSNYYVDQLSDSERKRIEGVFNADMVATSYEKASHLYSMTVDGKSNVVTDSALAAGTRLGNSAILPGTFGSSDHVPFHRAGIPAALFIWMGIDSWDPLVYHIEKVYHTPQDTIAENVSKEKMQTALDIIGAAIFDLARKNN